MVFTRFGGDIFNILILYPLTASLFDFERSHNEGWNAFHQTDAIHHQLYHNKSRYVFANYTPLSDRRRFVEIRRPDPLQAHIWQSATAPSIDVRAGGSLPAAVSTGRNSGQTQTG